MNVLTRTLRRRLSTDKQDAEFARWSCFVAGVALLPLGLRAATRLSESNGELLVAVLAVLMLATQLIVLGLLVPRAMGQDEA